MAATAGPRNLRVAGRTPAPPGTASLLDRQVGSQLPRGTAHSLFVGIVATGRGDFLMRGLARWVAVMGALTYGVTGAVWGAKNEGLFGLTRNASDIQLWLGVGAALVIVGFSLHGWGRRLWAAAPVGPLAAVALILGAALNVVSAVIDFAIFGTLGLGLGLILLAVAAFQHRLGALPDRWLLAASAVLSVTWNTETSTVWFLAVNGALWVVLSLRLLGATADAGVPAES